MCGNIVYVIHLQCIIGICVIHYTMQGPGVQFEVLVDSEDVNVPRYLNAELGSERRELTFLKFDAITPQQSFFVVPEVCQQ